MLTTALVALILWLVVRQALPYAAAALHHPTVPRRVRIIIRLEVRIAFQGEGAGPANEVHLVGLGGAPEPPEPVEDEEGIPIVQIIAQGAPGAHAPLMGSLYGILGLQAE